MEGLRAGILVGQLVLVTFYSILIDCLTNWQSVAHEAQERIYKESLNLPEVKMWSNVLKSQRSSDQEGYQTDFKGVRYRQEYSFNGVSSHSHGGDNSNKAYYSEPETGNTPGDKRRDREPRVQLVDIDID